MTDQSAIDALTAVFFSAFDNRAGAPPIDTLREVCLAEAVIARCVDESPQVMTLEAFIAPRRQMLTDGTLTDFHERETSHATQISARIAQRWCTFEKSGRLKGVAFHGTGTKTLQFIKTGRGWRISAVAWDERV